MERKLLALLIGVMLLSIVISGCTDDGGTEGTGDEDGNGDNGDGNGDSGDGDGGDDTGDDGGDDTGPGDNDTEPEPGPEPTPGAGWNVILDETDALGPGGPIRLLYVEYEALVDDGVTVVFINLTPTNESGDDLDLYVTGPNGEEYASASSGVEESIRIDPMEGAYVASGAYTVRVQVYLAMNPVDYRVVGIEHIY